MALSTGREWASFASGLFDSHLWAKLGAQVVASRFRRSYFGGLWLAFNNLAFSLGAGLIWSRIFQIDPAFLIPFIGVGFAIWGFVSASFVEGSTAFVHAGGYIKAMPLPLSIFVMRVLYAQSVYLFVGAGVALATGAFFGRSFEPGIVWAIPGLALLLLVGLCTMSLTAYLGARFRDLTHGIQSLFQILFVITPIIYTPDMLIARGFGGFLYANPLYSMIEIVRIPLLEYRPAEPLHYAIAGGYCGLAIVFTMILSKAWTGRIAYWV